MIGSRGSRLARVQAEWVGQRLRAVWPDLEVEIRTFSTSGDRDRATPLPEIGGKGVFTADIERRLRSGAIDAAVHSLKDLPTAGPDDLAVLAVAGREDPRDVLVVAPTAGGGSGIRDLPAHASVGTSSIRRSAQVRGLRPDLRVRPIRGNVETRLARLESGEYDAIILAAAGLARLGIAPEGLVALDPPAWLPAPGQGALAVQAMADDERARALCEAIDDAEARAATTAERSLLHRLEGGCHLPVGALATIEGQRLRLAAAVYPVEPGPGRTVLGGEERGAAADAADLGERLAERLLSAGAGRLLDAASTPPAEGAE